MGQPRASGSYRGQGTRFEQLRQVSRDALSAAVERTVAAAIAFTTIPKYPSATKLQARNYSMDDPQRFQAMESARPLGWR